ncbi:MAG: peptidoglycan DD-metalloendopeptidase family protein [Bacteroidales bacterium]|nr:peptidoglycan DD-metalloendopeptidase family protein [Bacteroidales bacterium]
MRPFLLALLACLLASGLSAQTSKRLTDLEQKRKAALERIETASRELNKTKTTTKNTLIKLNVLNDQIKARESFLNVLNKELRTLDGEVSETKAAYEEQSRRLSIKKDGYARSLRLMSKRNKSEDRWMFLLSSSDLAQMTRRMRYLSEYADFQKVQAVEITRKQAELNEKRLALERAYREKEAVKRKEVQETTILAREKKQKDALVSTLKKQEKSLTAEMQRQKKLADQLNRQIENIIAEEARKAAAAAAKDKNRTAAVKGGYAMTEAEKKLSGDFGKLQGQLPYPLSKPGVIVVHYGEQKFHELKHVQNSSKGIDIKTGAGAEALAIYNGVVSKVFALPGFNNSVIVRHGNYLSVYANLESIHVKAGDKVKTGQSLGKIFIDEAQGNQTILHFQLWKDTQRLNPELWIHK